jgi:cytosine/adenosine deaminase-related metal-dependent hydrolase
MIETVDILIEHGTLLTLNTHRHIITDGAVAIRGDRIAAVGKTADLRSGFKGKKVIDASRRVVMPGLVDGHAHLGEIARGLIPDTLKTSDWLKFWCYPYMAAITEEDEYWYAKCLMAEMIRSGTTCFVEPGCMWLSTTIKAIEDAGMRAATGSWVWDHAGPDGHKCPEYFKKMTLREALDLTESNIKAFDGMADGRIKCFATIEGVGTCSDDLMLGAKELADKYGTFTLMHKASSREEVASEIKATGHRPVEHMYRIGSLGSNVYLNHMTAVELFEVDMLAETDTKVCQNPPAALKLAKGTTQMSRFQEMRAKGVTVCLGCDGVNSGDHKDMFRSMYLAATLPKDAKIDPEAITAEEVIEMATLAGCRATGWESELGSLEPGKKADIILINVDRPEWVPTYNYVYSLVYTASGDSVDTSIVDGRILMENRQLTTIDLEEVHAHCRALAPKLAARAKVKPQSRWPII